MQKKLLAVAVAGALVGPATAMAQSSVTIYGTLNPAFESRSATGGDTATSPGTAAPQSSFRTAAQYTATPQDTASRIHAQSAGSNFGLRVREDLGGSMYAWAQIELSVQVGGYSPPSQAAGGSHTTFRNTALALGSSAWGDIVFGGWDTPYTVNMNAAPQHAAYANQSTSFSGGFFGSTAFAQVTVSNYDPTALCNAGAGFTGYTPGNCFTAATSFARREPNIVQYWSPNWSGFQVKAMYKAENMKQPVTGTGAAAGVTNATPNTLDPRAYGGSLTYSAGPLYVGLGYEKHKDFIAIGVRTLGANIPLGGANINGVNSTATFTAGATGINGSDDSAWNLNARYTFGAFTVGGYYEAVKWSAQYAGISATGGDITEMKAKKWGMEGAWVGGPHTVGIRYARANNMQGSVSQVAGQNNQFVGDGTKATAWIFGYGYSLSKRTSLGLYHTRISNDPNARYTGVVFGGIAPAAGGDPKYTGVVLRHSF